MTASLVGTRFTATHRRSVVLYTLPVMVLWSFAMVFFSQHWVALFLGVPFAVSFVRLYRLTSRPMSFELQDDGLWVVDSQQMIPYYAIRVLEYLPTQKQPRVSMIVTSDSGSVLIPASSDINLEQLFFFLCDRAALEQAGSLPVVLQRYYDEKATRHGEECVVALTARSRPGGRPARPQPREFGNSLLLSALLVLPATIFEPGFLVESIVCAVAGGMARRVSRESTKRLKLFRKVEESAIVISPDGLAMKQGDVSGAIEWDRVQDVSLRNVAHAIEYNAGMVGMAGQIVLKAGNSPVLIRDVYTQPLYWIFTCLLNARERHRHLTPSQESDDAADYHEGADSYGDSPFRPPRSR